MWIKYTAMAEVAEQRETTARRARREGTEGRDGNWQSVEMKGALQRLYVTGRKWNTVPTSQASRP